MDQLFVSVDLKQPRKNPWRRNYKDKLVMGLRPDATLDRRCEEGPSKDLEDLLEIALNKKVVLLEAAKNMEVNKITIE